MKNSKSSEYDRDGTKKKKFGSHGRAESMKRKNKQRLGGGGLSLEAFANAKANNNNYNPALIIVWVELLNCSVAHLKLKPTVDISEGRDRIKQHSTR
ncbi:hypothetical protein Scep_030594 [Stephania cephalantha]|uniref:Uncharacterized protein n=1 Tax=Stephania cephalantha TaxID=152367 RepID=A0AAP0E347_9MAGN